MWKILFGLFGIISCTLSFAQVKVPTYTIKNCNLLSGYNGNSFTEFIPIKENTPLVIIGKWETAIYTVSYNKCVYQIYSGNVVSDDWALFDKKMKEYVDSVETAKKDSIQEVELRKKYVEDSIQKARDLAVEIAHLAYIAKKDSLKNIADSLIKRVKSKYPIYIEYIRTSYPNSAGGVDLNVSIENTGDKTIKYITFIGYPINAVNDRCACEIRKYSTASPRGVGPILSGETASYSFENLWYNSTIVKYVPVSIKIQYMDNSFKSVSQSALKEMANIKLKVDELVNN